MHADDDLLLLVNKSNPIPSGFHPEIVMISEYADDDVCGDIRCVSALTSMVSDCRNAGFKVIITSGYRSVDRQSSILEDKIRSYMDQGYERNLAIFEAGKLVAPPGCSEHHTGLAFDILHEDCVDLVENTPLTPHHEWLIAHCHEYGFILRYPENAVSITGIAFEPWHYRYVGKEAAEKIHRLGITLEEFLLLDQAQSITQQNRSIFS